MTYHDKIACLGDLHIGASDAKLSKKVVSYGKRKVSWNAHAIKKFHFKKMVIVVTKQLKEATFEAHSAWHKVFLPIFVCL